LLYCYTT